MGKVLSGELSCPCDRSCFLTCTNVQGAIVVALVSVWAWALVWHGHWHHTGKFYIKVFYVMDKGLSGKLSCKWTGVGSEGKFFFEFQYTFLDGALIKKLGLLSKKKKKRTLSEIMCTF